MLTSNGYRLDESPNRLGRLYGVPGREMNDRDALWCRLRRDGYLYLRGLLDPADVLALRRYYFDRTGLADAQGVARGNLDRAKLREVLFGEIVPGETYLAFCRQPAIRGWYAWFLGGETFLHRRKIIRHTAPGDSGIGAATQATWSTCATALIGSCPPDPAGRLPGRTRRPDLSRRQPSPGLRDEAEGSAQTAGNVDHGGPTRARRRVRHTVAGRRLRGRGLVVHTAHTVHAALDNVDPGGVMRLSTDIRYQRADQPIDLRWQHDWHDRDGL